MNFSLSSWSGHPDKYHQVYYCLSFYSLETCSHAEAQKRKKYENRYHRIQKSCLHIHTSRFLKTTFIEQYLHASILFKQSSFRCFSRSHRRTSTSQLFVQGTYSKRQTFKWDYEENTDAIKHIHYVIFI